MSERCRRYAIRKTVLGVGSVVIGSFLLTAHVEASEVDEGSSQDVVENILNSDDVDDISVEYELAIDVDDEINELAHVDLDNEANETILDSLEEKVVGQMQPLDDKTKNVTEEEIATSLESKLVEQAEDSSVIVIDEGFVDDESNQNRERLDEIEEEDDEKNREVDEFVFDEVISEDLEVYDLQAVKANVGDEKDYKLSIKQLSEDREYYLGERVSYQVRIDNLSGALLPEGSYLEILAKEDETRYLSLSDTIYGDSSSQSTVFIDGVDYLRSTVDIRGLSGGYKSVLFDYVSSKEPNEDRVNQLDLRLMGPNDEMFDQLVYEKEQKRSVEGWWETPINYVNYGDDTVSYINLHDKRGYLLGVYDSDVSEDVFRSEIPGSFKTPYSSPRWTKGYLIPDQENTIFEVTVPDGFEMRFQGEVVVGEGTHTLPLTADMTDKDGVLSYVLSYTGNLDEFENGDYSLGFKVLHQSRDFNGGRPYEVFTEDQIQLVVLDESDVLDNKLYIKVETSMGGGSFTSGPQGYGGFAGWSRSASEEIKRDQLSSFKTRLTVNSNNQIPNQEVPLRYVDYDFLQLETGDVFLAPNETVNVSFNGELLKDFTIGYVNANGEHVSDITDASALRVLFDEDFMLSENNDRLVLEFSHKILDSEALQNGLLSTKADVNNHFETPITINYLKTPYQLDDWVGVSENIALRIPIYDRIPPVITSVGDMLYFGPKTYGEPIDLEIYAAGSFTPFDREYEGGYKLTFTVPSGMKWENAPEGLRLDSDDGSDAVWVYEDLNNRYSDMGLFVNWRFAKLYPTLRSLRDMDEDGNYRIPVKLEVDWNRTGLNSNASDVLEDEMVILYRAPEGLTVESSISGITENATLSYDRLLPDEAMNIFVTLGNFDSSFSSENTDNGYNTLMSVLPNTQGIGFDGKEIDKSTSDVVLTGVLDTVDDRFDVYGTTDTLVINKRTGDYKYQLLSDIDDLSEVTALQFKLKAGESVGVGEVLDFGYSVLPTERIENTEAYFASQAGFSEGVRSDYKSLPTNVVTAYPSAIEIPYRFEWYQKLADDTNFTSVSQGEELLISKLDRSKYQVKDFKVFNKNNDLVSSRGSAQGLSLNALLNPNNALNIIESSSFVDLDRVELTLLYDGVFVDHVMVGLDEAFPSYSDHSLTPAVIGIYETLSTDIVESVQAESTGIPFDTEYRLNPNMLDGEERVIQEGKNGMIITTNQNEYIYGVELGDLGEVVERREPVNRIIEVGTGENLQVTVEYQTAPHETEYRYNSTLEPDEEREVYPGKDGVLRVTTVYQKVVVEDKNDPDYYPDGIVRVEEEIIEEPVNRVVEIGDEWPTPMPNENYAFIGFSGYETIPFETIVRENSKLPEGEEREIQEGRDGVNVIALFREYFLDELDNPDTYTETFVIREAQDRIIEVGTGVVGEDVVVVTEEIPVPEPIRQEDPNLPEGYERVGQKGMPGLVEITTATPTLNGEPSGDPVITRHVIQEAKPEIIYVGTGPWPKDEVSYEPIPFETEVRENPNLLEGEERVIQEGREGRMRVLRISLDNVDLTDEDEFDVEYTVIRRVDYKPVTHIVEVGTGENLNVTVTYEPIPFKTHYEQVPDLEPGEERIVQVGVDGEMKITTIEPIDVTEGSGLETRVEKEVIKEPIDLYIEVGDEIRPVDPVLIGYDFIMYEWESVPVETVYRETSELPKGVEREVQGGLTGIIRIAVFERAEPPVAPEEPFHEEGEGFSFDSDYVWVVQGNDFDESEFVRIPEVIREMQVRIIEVGTGIVGEDVTTETKEVPAPAEPVYKENPNLPEGEERVVQEATPGEVEVTTKTPTLDGKPTGEEPVVTEVVTKEPKPKIIEVGTGVVGEDVTTETKEVPGPTEPVYKENPNLPEGEERVVQEATPGEVEVTTKVPTLNGEPTGEAPVVTEVVIKEPKPEIIEVGTGVVGEDVTTEIKEVPAPTEPIIKENPNLPEGEERVVQEATPGEVEVTTKVPTLNGEPAGEDPVVTEVVTKEPKPEIIEVGTGIVGEDISTEIKEVPAPTEPIYRENSNLPEGEERVIQEATPGEVEITTKVPTLNGEPTGEAPVVTEVVTKEPKPKVIEVGTGVVGEDITTETKEVPAPSEPIIKENPNLPEGEERVVQEATPGEVEVTTKVPTLNGEPTGEDPIVTEVVTKEPKPKVIEVGTGVVGEDTSTETKEVPAPEEPIIRENFDLPEGEERVVQEAKPGKVEVTITTPTLNGEPTGEESTVTEVVIEEPQPEIVEIGTGVVGEDVSTEIQDVPAPTEPIIQENPNLPEGEEKVIQEPKPGKVEVTTTTPTLNGEPNGEPSVTETVLEEPTPEIIEVGTGIVGEIVETETVEIPYDVERVENKDIPEGEEVVTQVGKVGEKVITTTTPTLNGEPNGESVVTEEITKEPITEIIQVGTGVVGEKVETEVKDLPAPEEPVFVENTDLPEGEERVVQEATPGKVEITTVIPTLNGEESSSTPPPTVIETVIEEPQPEIIEIGTGVVGEIVETETVEVPYDVERIEDKDIPEGEEVVSQVGKVGEKVITTTTPTLNGNVSGDPVVTEEVTKEPVSEVIQVGTGVVGEDTSTEIQDVPAPTEPVIKENPNLPEGEERVVQKSKPGKVEIVTTTPTLNGEPTGEEPIVTEIVIEEPTPEIVEIGTGVVGEDISTEVKEVPAPKDPVIKENPNLPEGEERVVQEAKPGKVEIVTTTPTLNGEPTGEEPVVTETVIEEPTPEIIEIGTGIVGEDISTEVKEVPAPKDLVIKENPDLPEGEERVVQESKPGKVEITTTTPTLNGEPTGEDPVVTEVVIEEPQPEVIEVGTGVVEDKSTTDIDRIPAPTEPIIHENPNLPEGEERVVQEAQPGTKKVTTTTPTLNGEPFGDPVVTEEVIEEPRPEIIEIGTGVVGEDILTETKEIPAPTEPIIRENPDLPEGEERVVQEAVPGEVEITTTIPTLNGEPYGDPIVTETIVKEPQSEIIEMGTKPLGDEPEDDDGYVGEWVVPEDLGGFGRPVVVEASEGDDDDDTEELESSSGDDLGLAGDGQGSGTAGYAQDDEDALPNTGEVALGLTNALGMVGLGGAVDVLRRRRKK